MHPFLPLGLFLSVLPACVAGPLIPISMRANNAPSTITGSGLSGDAVFAGTNRYVVFLSDAPDLVTNDFNGSLVDVFVRDRITGRTELVSRSPAGQSFNGRSSEFSVSGDGTLIAFTVEGSDASAGDTNRVNDVYVRDLKIGTTRLVSVNVSGTGAGNTASSNPELSGDGRFIVFESEATNLTANVDTNGASDVFLRDLQEGSTEVLSTAPGGSTGSAAAFSPQINVDGRVVAYRCLATDFPLIEDNGTTLVLWRRSEQLRRIRLSPTARFQLPIWVEDFILSRNGRYLAFRVQGPSGNINFVSTWWTDLESGRLERVAGDLPVLQEPLSLADDGQTLALTVRPERSGLSDQIRIWKADSGLHTMDEMRTTVPPVGTDPATSQLPQLSSDGNSLLFVSSSPVPEAGVLAEGSSRLYHRVLATGAMHHMAAEANYAQAAFSPDGTEVVLQVEEPVSLLDLNESYDVITVNLADGQTSPISVTESAMEKRTATGISRGAGTPSDDGRFVPFVSLADDLVPGDTSRGYDGYLFDRSFGAVQPMATALFSGDSQGAMGCLRISRDGRTALFMSSQPGLVAGDTNQLADIFTRDLTTGVVTLVSAIDGTDDSINGTVVEAQFSADGLWVAFLLDTSRGNPFVNQQDLYLRDIIGHRTYRVSDPDLSSEPGLPLREITSFQLSADGKVIAFFGVQDTTKLTFAYLYQHQEHSLTRLTSDPSAVTLSQNGQRAFFTLGGPSIAPVPSPGLYYIDKGGADQKRLLRYWVTDLQSSEDGQVLAYSYQSSIGDKITWQVGVISIGTLTDEILSTAPDGALGNDHSRNPQISADGRWVVFRSHATNLLPGLSPGQEQIFAYDRYAGVLTVLSQSAEGVLGNGFSNRPRISADGHWASFSTSADNLIPHDLNGLSDVVLTEVTANPFIDTDHDGFPDRWESDYFGLLAPEADGDPDGDGSSNAEEWLARTSPVDSESRLSLQATPLPTGELGLLWPGRAGVKYQIQRIDSWEDSTRWEPDGPGVLGHGGMMSLGVPMKAEASAFLRVVVLP